MNHPRIAAEIQKWWWWTDHHDLQAIVMWYIINMGMLKMGLDEMALLIKRCSYLSSYHRHSMAALVYRSFCCFLFQFSICHENIVFLLFFCSLLLAIFLVFNFYSLQFPPSIAKEFVSTCYLLVLFLHANNLLFYAPRDFPNLPLPVLLCLILSPPPLTTSMVLG